ncbi:MAG: glycosyltransferase family 39 protein [Chlorogloea purpurea SAG 13.99]|nr:glycosyltransferase family 39 protein [Chlorogloea purpurea SAG 13.99]
MIGGILLRFNNLEGKLYSNDETFSTTYIYGQQLTEVIETKIISAKDLQSYQRLKTSESLGEGIGRVIRQPYVFPPLYPILMQFWARITDRWFTNPAMITRSLSVVISLFSLPFAYWLYWELCESHTIAWLGTALIAVSPFQLQYAQIVRTYSLTITATFLASALFLRCYKFPGRSNWLLYGLSIAIGLYSNVLFGFVIIGHAIYTLWTQRVRWNSIVKNYTWSSCLGIFLFMPWFIRFITDEKLLNYSVAQPAQGGASLKSLVTDWIKIIPKFFVDLNDPWIESTAQFISLQKIFTPLILLLSMASLVFIIIYSPKNIRRFILSLIFAGGVLLMLKDIILGGTFSTRPRYLIPYVIGIELAVGIFLGYSLASPVHWWRKLGQFLLVLVLTGGLLSCYVISSSPSWWAFGAPDYPLMAEKINKQTLPVVIYDDFGDALTMSYLVNENTKFHLTRNIEQNLLKDDGKIYQGYEQIILFKPQETIKEKIQRSARWNLQSLFNNKNNNIPNVPQLWSASRK